MQSFWIPWTGTLVWKKGVISYFDTEGKFLSWTSWEGILIDYEEHPYRGFAPKDVVRQRIYKEAVRDHLTYFNTSPRLYKATDIIDKKTYASSEHVRFLEEQFHARYSVTMAFGINAYIQVTIFKKRLLRGTLQTRRWRN